MARVLNRSVVVLVASAFLLFGASCSNKDNKPSSATADVDPTEDPTVFPDPEGGVPAALTTSSLPDPSMLPADDPTPSQLAAATTMWIPKDAGEIQALLLQEAAGNASPIEIDALDRLYSETPTPPDPGQL